MMPYLGPELTRILIEEWSSPTRSARLRNRTGPGTLQSVAPGWFAAFKRICTLMNGLSKEDETK